ncbi:MAG TPA: hypothetical protein DEP42_05520 [Ruminococcaceae bacterium]|nr:hypothetical protein [Oscillospiraceae bacterium]
MDEQKQMTLMNENGRKIGLLHYDLISRAMDCATGTTYGIRVVLNNEDGTVSSCKVEDISTIPGQVEKLLVSLVKNTVTPITLLDVVEDYLACI